MNEQYEPYGGWILQEKVNVMSNKTKILASAVNTNNISLVLLGANGRPMPHVIDKGHPHFAKIKEKVSRNDANGLEEMISISKAITKWGNGTIIVQNGEVRYNGNVIHNSLTRRIMAMLEQSLDVTPLVNFLIRLENNPSMTARNELYDFLSGNNLPFTRDGRFLAYKRVRGDYKDIYTGTMSNHVGATVSMPRSQVDDNRNNTCSRGLHFASLGYARDSYGHDHGNRMVILAIDPADVVSIPTDYNNQKGRAWKYDVIGEIPLDNLYQKDYLEAHVVVETQNYDREEEDMTSFLSRKASLQRRDSRGRFLKNKSR